MDNKIAIQTRVGSRIREARLSRQRSESDIAKALSLSSEDYSLIERGQYLLTSKLLSQLASEIGIDVCNLLRDASMDQRGENIVDSYNPQQLTALIINRVQRVSSVKDLRLIMHFLDTLI